MSTLSQFAPFAGGGLKSFQTGYVKATRSSGSGEDFNYTDVTVSSVSTSKAITGFSGGWGFDLLRAGFIYPGYGSTMWTTTRMTSATNLRIGIATDTTTGGGPPGVSGRWQIAEAN